MSTAHADAEEKASTEEASVQEEEEEEPEPEDARLFNVGHKGLLYLSPPFFFCRQLQPIIREECKQSSKCAALTKHFEHCQEKVQSGHGYKGEDCVEEL